MEKTDDAKAKGRISRKWVLIAVSVAVVVLFIIIAMPAVQSARVISAVDKITYNQAVSASSVTQDYIKANQEAYDSVVNMGESALPTLLKYLATGDNGLKGVIVANMCADITAKGEYDLWSAQNWFEKHGLALYEKYVGIYYLPKGTANP